MTKDFYILRSSTNPDLYYVNGKEFLTRDILEAERYSTPGEALKQWNDSPAWRVCLVHVDIKII